jgi:hypothetical protein
VAFRLPEQIRRRTSLRPGTLNPGRCEVQERAFSCSHISYLGKTAEPSASRDSTLLALFFIIIIVIVILRSPRRNTVVLVSDAFGCRQETTRWRATPWPRAT